jgi:hypothetical protein
VRVKPRAQGNTWGRSYLPPGDLYKMHDMLGNVPLAISLPMIGVCWLLFS